MTNLKLIISTRTQEEFDRVRDWAERNNVGAPFRGAYKKFGKKLCIRYEGTEEALTFEGFDSSDFYKKRFPNHTFLSFPEFEKKYLISKQ